MLTADGEESAIILERLDDVEVRRRPNANSSITT